MKHLGIRYWVLGMAVALLVAGCDPTETPTPTISPLPTPTMVSPLPTPTMVSPLPTPTQQHSPLPTPVLEPQAAREFWVAHDEEVKVYHTGTTTPTLFWAVKLLDESGGVVYSETLDTGVPGPSVTGTGQFDGSFFFDYPLMDEDAPEWAQCWWGSEEMYVMDPNEELRLVDRIDCVFTGTQDAEGYWYVGVVEGLEFRVYLPIAMHVGE